jgi:putative ABC transport system permease protein
LLVDPTRAPALYDQLQHAPQAMAIGIRRSTFDSFQSMSETSLDFVRTIVLIFATIIAFGVVFIASALVVRRRIDRLDLIEVLKARE